MTIKQIEDMCAEVAELIQSINLKVETDVSSEYIYVDTDYLKGAQDAGRSD